MYSDTGLSASFNKANSFFTSHKSLSFSQRVPTNVNCCFPFMGGNEILGLVFSRTSEIAGSIKRNPEIPSLFNLSGRYKYSQGKLTSDSSKANLMRSPAFGFCTIAAKLCVKSLNKGGGNKITASRLPSAVASSAVIFI